MQLLLSALQALPEYKALLSALDAGACPAAVSGLAGVHRAYFAAAAHRDTGRPVVILCADDAECQRLAEDMGAPTGPTLPPPSGGSRAARWRCSAPTTPSASAWWRT